jgi:hypothetical protein
MRRVVVIGLVASAGWLGGVATATSDKAGVICTYGGGAVSRVVGDRLTCLQKAVYKPFGRQPSVLAARTGTWNLCAWIVNAQVSGIQDVVVRRLFENLQLTCRGVYRGG